MTDKPEDPTACRAICRNRRCMTDMDVWPDLCGPYLATPDANPGGGDPKER